jgi:hypothetical protein
MSFNAPRASKAREAPEWCRHGHQKMGSDPTGSGWVLIWAGTIALLCEVGHALAKADAKSDVRLKTDTARMVEGAEKHEARSADFLGIHGAGQKPALERS